MSYRQQLLFGEEVIEKLSPRELEVLTFIAKGWTTADIAGHLFISFETVKSHVKHIFAKLGTNTRAGAVVIALKDGQLSLSDL